MRMHFGEFDLDRETRRVLWIDAPTVSRRHARIVVTEGTAVLEDLGSKNGTHLNGVRLTAPVTLADGDEIWLPCAELPAAECLVLVPFPV
jgi:pSer/pThr/pTyr-binding forkhead associated (FHA) protein